MIKNMQEMHFTLTCVLSVMQTLAPSIMNQWLRRCRISWLISYRFLYAFNILEAIYMY